MKFLIVNAHIVAQI